MTAYRLLVLLPVVFFHLMLPVDPYRDPNCPNSGPSDDEALRFQGRPQTCAIGCEGSLVELYCCTLGYLRMYWMKQERDSHIWQVVPIGSHYLMDAKDENQSLTMEDVSIEEDNTSFRCVAEDSHGRRISHDIKMDIRDCSVYVGDPEFSHPGNETLHVLPGQPHVLTCKVFFGPNYQHQMFPPNLRWEKDGHVWRRRTNGTLVVNERMNITWWFEDVFIRSLLYLYNTTSEEYGRYVCNADTIMWSGQRYVDVKYDNRDLLERLPLTLASIFASLVVLIVVAGLIYYRYRVDILLFYKDRWKRPALASQDILYDAFIVHNDCDPADERFCLEEILPALEDKHGYRLAIVERDCLPGRFLVGVYNELCHASQSTVFLLSPAFLQSDICRYILDWVVEEDRRHLIFVYREPLADAEFPEQAKDFLAAIKVAQHVLYWPGENNSKQARFWKQLRYALPPRLDSSTGAKPRPFPEEGSSHDTENRAPESQTDRSSNQWLPEREGVSHQVTPLLQDASAQISETGECPEDYIESNEKKASTATGGHLDDQLC